MRKSEQIHRILQIYDQLNNGETINKLETSHRLSVSMRTIQRDISTIQEHLANSFSGQMIEYDGQRKGYILTGNKTKALPVEQVFIIAKIIIASRAFSIDELRTFITNLLGHSTLKNKEIVYTMLEKELTYYDELPHTKNRLCDLIWTVTECIVKDKYMEIMYEQPDKLQSYSIKPIHILFMKQYFYVIAVAYFKGCVLPVTYRLDRINSYSEQPNHPQINDNEYELLLPQQELTHTLDKSQSNATLIVWLSQYGKEREMIYPIEYHDQWYQC